MMLNCNSKYLIPAFMVISLFAAIGCFTKCGSDSKSGIDIPPENTGDVISPNLFGANIAWERNGDYIMENTELLVDRSFRVDAVDTDGKIIPGKKKYWIVPALNSGSVGWYNEEGDTTPAVGKHYPGYAQFSCSVEGDDVYTGIFQELAEGVKNGENYQVSFSSFGTGGTSQLLFYISNSDWTLTTGAQVVTVKENEWTRHVISIAADKDLTAPAYFNITLIKKGIVKIDEIRFSIADKMPVVRETPKERIRDLGIKSLRWPGGTLVDWFNWKDSIGPLLSRGELRAYGNYETPSLGLHEFLNLCEELNLTPFVQVNVLNSADDAADLVEYILGPEESTQGAIRLANGRALPWDVKYFEIGNEPPISMEESYYKYEGTELENAGSDYADRAKKIIDAMKIRAASINRSIQTSGIISAGVQLSDYINPQPQPIPDFGDEYYNVIKHLWMCFNWNEQVYSSLKEVNDVYHGHIYIYGEHREDPALHFRYLMSGGEILRKTIVEKIRPVINNMPVWITEYNVLIWPIEPQYYNYFSDFQSGMVVGDLLMNMIDARIDGAHIWNLAQKIIFGICNPDDWSLNPEGLVFKMFSVMAGEERLLVTIDNTSKVSLITPITERITMIPDNFEYPVVSAIASKNSSTGKPRVILINRDYTDDITVTVNLENFVPGNVVIYRYYNENPASTTGNSITLENVYISSPFTVTIPKHSISRVDFQ